MRFAAPCFATIILVLSAPLPGQPVGSRPATQPTESSVEVFNQRLLERVRIPKPQKTPAFVNAIPDRIGDILSQKHLCTDGPVWGLGKVSPDQALSFEECGSAMVVRLIQQYHLEGRFGSPDDDTRQAAIRYWQSWQDEHTGRFRDPRDPSRQVNEKYVVSLLGMLGAKPLYTWTTTGDEKTVDTTIFLQRTREDPDWAVGGWGVGSHTGLMAVEILRAINEGKTELIPDLERGVNQILSHQDATTGLWGAADADPMHKIGGTLKVIGRLYFSMGMTLPHSRKLADTLIAWQRDGTWFRHGQDSCVPRNVAEMMAYCVEVSDYRREEMLAAMALLAEDYRHWVTPDGRTLLKRDGDDGAVGIQYTTIYGLGILGAYLHWEDCRLPNPLNGPRGRGTHYRMSLDANGWARVIPASDDAGGSITDQAVPPSEKVQ